MNTSTPQKPGAEAFSFDGICRGIFSFFASLQLAIATIVALMLVLAAGTLVESRYGADAARILIYGTPWFVVVMIVLTLNLACSALSRLPWQKKHIGFVLTHLGIITILAGSMMTQKLAIDGQMALSEGSSGKWVTLKQPMLYFYTQNFQAERTIPLPEHALRWQGNKLLTELKNQDSTAQIALKQFYPKAKFESRWAASSAGPAALKVTLKNSFLNVSEWLADVPGGRETSLGPAVLKLASPSEPSAGQEKSEPHLDIRRGSEEFALAISEIKQLPFEKELAEDVKVKVIELYEYAFVENNMLKEGKAGEQAPNPAAVMEIIFGSKTEKHTVFAQFPDFPTVHGREQSEFAVSYHGPYNPAETRNELRFIPSGDGLAYEITSKDGTQTGKAAVGEEIATGWMDIKFTVDEWLPHASAQLDVKPLADDDKSENVSSAIQIEVRSGPESEVFWLNDGGQRTVSLEKGGLFEFVFARRQLNLGFEMMLKDFRVKNDPGTEKAASFESDVKLNDFTNGMTIEKTISMNQPLVHKGFRFYQASYSANPGEKESSVFAVGRDPGIPVKYAGALIMVSGILLMFYTRAYSTRNERGIR